MKPTARNGQVDGMASVQSEVQDDLLTLVEASVNESALTFRETVEAYTLRRLWGDVNHRAVLDLACGDGRHTRKLKQMGAQVVLGIDRCAERIRHALAAERRAPVGCRYRQAEVADLRLGSAFDVVSAAYLLSTARTADELYGLCKVAFEALQPGGRFVGFNDNVHTDPNEAPSLTRYGLAKQCQRRPSEGDEIVYRLAGEDDESFDLVHHYLSPQTYAAVFAAAGFEDFSWEGPFLDLEERRNPFWEDFMTHAPFIGFSATKPIRTMGQGYRGVA